MEKAHEIVLVGAVIKILQDAGSWCGETHIQMSSYVAKHVKKIPFSSDFILYKHGPFSFDLNSTLNNMRSQEIISVTSLGLGSTYSLNKGIWKAFDRASDGLFEKHEHKLTEVCVYLARKNVAELERIATAIYIRINFPMLQSLNDKKNKLVSLKPHIGSDQAKIAFEESLELFPEI